MLILHTDKDNIECCNTRAKYPKLKHSFFRDLQSKRPRLDSPCCLGLTPATLKPGQQFPLLSHFCKCVKLEGNFYVRHLKTGERKKKCGSEWHFTDIQLPKQTYLQQNNGCEPVVWFTILLISMRDSNMVFLLGNLISPALPLWHPLAPSDATSSARAGRISSTVEVSKLDVCTWSRHSRILLQLLEWNGHLQRWFTRFVLDSKFKIRWVISGRRFSFFFFLWNNFKGIYVSIYVSSLDFWLSKLM